MIPSKDDGNDSQGAREGGAPLPGPTVLRGRRGARCALALLAAAALALLSPVPVRAQEAVAQPRTFVFGLVEGKVLVRTVRHAINPAATAPDVADVAAVDHPLPFPLVVTLYHKGRPKWVKFESEPTLRKSAEKAAEELAALAASTPEIQALFSEAIIELEVVLRSEPLADARDFVVDQHLVPGIHGVGYMMDRERVVLTPLQLLRHWYKPDLLTSAFKDQENRTPPVDFLADRLRTVSYVEVSPGGKILSLYRGNVLLNQPDADEMTLALSYIGRWLIRTQSDRGAFFGTFHPADESAIPLESDRVPHLRAAAALIRFSQLLGAEAPTEAAERAVRYAVEAVEEDADRRYVYVPAGQDTILASALLLTALCQRAQAATPPVADGRMVSLGKLLSEMTDRNGRLYARIPGPGGKAPFEIRSEVYAEVLLALSLLEQIAPTPSVGEAAERIVALLSEDRGMPPFPVARTGQAFAQYYVVHPLKENATRVIRLAGKLAERQIVESPWGDYDGGFARPDLAPDCLTTAEHMEAIAAGYEVARTLGQRRDDLAEAVRRGAWFLVNMQYRPVNSFYLPRQDAVRGAVRTSPEDLRVRLDANAVSLQALIRAASVTAVTFPQAIPDNDAENSRKSN